MCLVIGRKMSLVEKEAEALISMLRMLQVNLLACETVDRGEDWSSELAVLDHNGPKKQ